MKRSVLGLRGIRRRSLHLVGLSLGLGFMSLMGLVGASPSYAHNEEGATAEGCEFFLDQFHEQGKAAAQQTDDSIAAHLEAHQLSEMFTLDQQGDTLATRYPFIVYNAAQRLISVVNSQPSQSIPDPQTGVGIMVRYSLFSDGLDITGGRRVVGHYGAIDRFVGHLRNAADGNRVGNYLVMFVGNPGTAKSEVLDIFREALKRVTLSDPRFFHYSYEWIGLSSIPQLQRDFPKSATTAVGCPLHHTPFVVLPETLQTAVLNHARPKLEAKLGHQLAPEKKMCRHCQYIHDALMAHYFPNKQPTVQEMVEKLNRHIRIRRLVMDDSMIPLIPPQGNDVDLGALFAARNPEYITYGPTHPLYYNYNGLLTGANGAIAYFDEILKNNRHNFLSPMLTVFQSRSYTYGGAPIKLDIYFASATNTEEYVKIQEAAKVHKDPLLDRLIPIPMNWTIKTDEVAKIMTYEVKGLHMRSLQEAGAKAVPVHTGRNLDNLFPEHLNPQKAMLGPDRRFNLDIRFGAGENAQKIHISPQALLYLSRIVALSRMDFSPETIGNFYKGFGQTQTFVPLPLFTDPIARLNMLEGRGFVQNTVLQEFWRFSKSIEHPEGTFGISARDASKVLGYAIDQARKPGEEGCITPLLIKVALDHFIEEKTIGASDEERTRIALYAYEVSRRMTAPAFKRDLTFAVTAAEGDGVDALYDQVLLELEAINGDPQATSYSHPTNGRSVAINKNRLDAIGKNYKQQTGRDLNFNEILTFERAARRAGRAAETRRNPELLDAVSTYQVDVTLAAHGNKLEQVIAMLAGNLEPNASQKGELDRISEVLHHKLGYCHVCAQQAMQLIHPVDSMPEPGSEGQGQ